MADDFSRPLTVALRGSRMARAFLACCGWRVSGEGLPGLQGLVVVYPHTSNWDFVMLVLARWALGLPAKFWGKDSLFAVPLLGAWLRWMGGVPVNRDAPRGVVGEMARVLEQNRSRQSFFWLALAPEGTRKLTAGWRSGFYQLALAAKVPVGVCSLNYARKTIELENFFLLSGDVQTDMQRIALVLQSAAAKHPELAAPIRLIEK